MVSDAVLKYLWTIFVVTSNILLVTSEVLYEIFKVSFVDLINLDCQRLPYEIILAGSCLKPISKRMGLIRIHLDPTILVRNFLGLIQIQPI